MKARIITVTRKAIPHPMAEILSCFLSIWIRLEYSGDAFNSSEVTSRMIAITANHKLISENVNGKFMLPTPAKL